MGAMNELDIILTEASEKGEKASKRLNAAIDAIEGNLGGRSIKCQELRAAAADAYDAAVDLPIEIREFFDADDSQPTESEPQLVTLVKEIHEKLVNGTERLVFEVDPTNSAAVLDMTRPGTLRSGDILIEKGSGVKLLNGTLTNYSPGAVVEHPPTGYGVRIYYADGTMEEIHDVDGVQLANLNDGTFPFGFMNIEEDDQDGPGGHRAGYWDEDGRFEPFSDREQPRPGW